MQTIGAWNDLAPHGIVPLTGEACGLGYRILCDVTAAGKRILEKALGVRSLELHENWNRGSDEQPHIGSIMLAPELLVPIGAFALLEHGCTEVWLVGTVLMGFEPDDPPEERQALGQLYEERRTRIFRYSGTAGDRNVHQVSRRTV